ncbi:paraquat-inducible protein A [Zwartia vadi]|uniref:paraquat-inducible protein A n=1 Tax=Zwartia vadi TaxID=3058168 RepID=UPI0025B618E0|nr:paraquat-inducible protein A [Zwartia vadi]MDN3986356.1 paraquat-inducible protein A [Zwartia vadi]
MPSASGHSVSKTTVQSPSLYPEPASARALTLTCHQCGAVYTRPVLEPDQWSQCVRCNSVLETYATFTPGAWLAIILTAIISLGFANAYPVATLYLQGQGQAATFFDAIAVVWREGYPEVAVVTFSVGFLLPAIHLCLLLWVLLPLSFGRLPMFFESALKAIDHLKPWCMVPVFLMGILVSVVKLAGLASLVAGVGLFATACAAILLTSLGRLSEHRLRMMAIDLGVPAELPVVPKPPSPAQISRAWALVISATILYIPANLLPIMNITTVGGSSGHTIVGGVIELLQMGSWDIALIVFVASVMVPVFKLVALSVLIGLTQYGAEHGLRKRTQIYRVVEFIGQWSMLDVFVVILLSALGQFGALLSIQPGSGAIAFGAVVILTMLAALSFDPRLAWRRAGHRRHVSSRFNI